MGETVLITGTSSGIGLSAAVECADAGHRVIATMRNLDRREELERTVASRGVSLSIEQLDVTAEQVADKVRELILKYGPLYGLVNNAGIAFGGAFEEQSDEDIREQFETNVFGLMSVTRAVLPSMRANGRGRIINISSMSGRLGFPAVSGYAATKHAVEGFSESLRWELEPFGITVLVVEPGTFRTPIFFANQRKGSKITEESPYAEFHEAIEKVVLQDAEKAPLPDAVGRGIAKLLGAANPAFRTIIGRDAQTLVTLRRVMPDRLFATGVRRYMSKLRSR